MNISEEAKTFLGLMEKNIVHKIGTEVLYKNHVDKEKESFQTVYDRISRKMTGEDDNKDMNDMQSLVEDLAKAILEYFDREKRMKKLTKDNAKMNPSSVSEPTPQGRTIQNFSLDNKCDNMRKSYLQKQIKQLADKGLGDSGLSQKIKDKARKITNRDSE